jgi:hypothetical protein
VSPQPNQKTMFVATFTRVIANKTKKKDCVTNRKKKGGYYFQSVQRNHHYKVLLGKTLENEKE